MDEVHKPSNYESYRQNSLDSTEITGLLFLRSFSYSTSDVHSIVSL
jgi:hypothetical protein